MHLLKMFKIAQHRNFEMDAKHVRQANQGMVVIEWTRSIIGIFESR